ncbi:putative HTH-type transcriptional regulator YybR [Roseibium alexandrii]|uniref:Putative HTH-type transcriptional regulator YybR n=2 Tax=Roseibium alexandrii TaxID=388408 RepID=A0A0M7A4Q5_9HYPH|nr:putative transcriptional regulator [Roseibium alexandrii DFL-11]CTQ68703.1 putative HTH-type transcriptional regulator YybR [Roseibium alexandrii]
MGSDMKVTFDPVTTILREIDRSQETSGEAPCPVRDVLDRTGDKWSVQVLLRLAPKPERFNALLRSVSGISQRMLTVTLKGLERDGLVERTVFDTRPPSVEYTLTPLGASLIEHLAALANWAIKNEPQISKNRAAYDNEAPAP